MNIGHHHDFDPFSEDSLKAVELVDFLPYSAAFEHVMYDYRLERVASYEYKHKKGETDDLEPITIDSSLMVNQFPETLKEIFHEVEYTIKQLQIVQVDTKEESKTSISFLANDVPHSILITDGTAQYETYNEYMEEVQYEHSTDAIVGLIAAFLYARQYNPDEAYRSSIALADSMIFTQRDPQVDLIERIVMTFGDLSGNAEVKTQSIFDSSISAPVIALLSNKESPDKSGVNNSLALNELGSIHNIPTSVETTIYQNVVNFEQDSAVFKIGRLANQFAEQRSTVLSGPAISTSELIDPEVNPERWLRTCTSFMNLIKIPMSVYAELDGAIENEPENEDENGEAATGA